ncbi:sugar-transfer associated ATP-grasp domain-containing protein [Pelagibius sp. CAU 1746]|uniref:sugar-transfer associated ATP-grasp domain-containing protein n=1 Tax=Pelagibius sp. CAU 1746 TaxID=3140370 RepID=UPI00325AEB57
MSNAAKQAAETPAEGNPADHAETVHEAAQNGPETGRAGLAAAQAAGGDDARARQDRLAHAVSHDRADQSKAKPPIAEYLRHAQQRSGRGPFELVREYFRLHRGPGRITLPEYIQYGVYDRQRHSPVGQARFITNTLHWPITHACCDMTWQATTEDKWLCSHILARSDIPVPQTLAVIDRSARRYPGTEKIATAAELRAFMTAPGVLPAFGKENRGICSFGAFLVETADNEGLALAGRGRVGYEACIDELVGDTPYLLQRLERNHDFFQRYTDALATVRLCILIADDGVKIPFAVLKLPARGNVADSFWRPGNLACKLDVASGEILTARTKDPLGTTDHDADPVSGAPLVGEHLPIWERVIELARNCAPIFRPVRYQSMDVAITPNGPVLIEINTGGGFDLPQLATGEGFLTDEVRDFFRACGYRRL